jgi:hypothetical protein
MLKQVELLSNFAFKFNLRRCTSGPAPNNWLIKDYIRELPPVLGAPRVTPPLVAPPHVMPPLADPPPVTPPLAAPPPVMSRMVAPPPVTPGAKLLALQGLRPRGATCDRCVNASTNHARPLTVTAPLPRGRSAHAFTYWYHTHLQQGLTLVQVILVRYPGWRQSVIDLSGSG